MEDNIANKSNIPEHGAVSTRWLILLLYSLLTFINAVLWISFAPINSLAATYYGVNTTMINLLSLGYMVLYLPGSIFAAFIFHKYGLRAGMWMGAILNTLAGVLRYVSTDTDAHSRSQGYVILLLGQILGSIAKQLFTNSPAKLAGEWFPTSERNLATTIASMCNPLGIAAGQVIPSVLVSASGGMPLLLLVEFIAAGVIAILSFAFFQKHPPVPPSLASISRAQFKAQRTLSSIGNGSVGSISENFETPTLLSSSSSTVNVQQTPSITASQQYAIPSLEDDSANECIDHHTVADFKELLHNREFLKLLFGFGLGLGLFNGLTTVIESLVQPCGYSSDDAGIFGGLIIGGGLIGAAIAGPIMDHTHAYRPILKTGVIVGAVGTIFFVVVLRPIKFELVAAAFGVLGLAMMPLLPVSFESAVEVTYPINEESSSGLLMLAGNLLGIVCVFTLDALIALRNNYIDIFSPASIFIVSAMALCALFLLSYQGDYKRLEAERKHAAEDSLLRNPV